MPWANRTVPCSMFVRLSVPTLLCHTQTDNTNAGPDKLQMRPNQKVFCYEHEKPWTWLRLRPQPTPNSNRNINHSHYKRPSTPCATPVIGRIALICFLPISATPIHRAKTNTGQWRVSMLYGQTTRRALDIFCASIKFNLYTFYSIGLWKVYQSKYS